MAEREAGESRLDRARQRLEHWREQHGGRGQAISEQLWDEIVEAARVAGVAATARALRVAPARLARRLALKRDPRLPAAGTVLRRVHGGVDHEVTVLESGFTYKGTSYSSLSAIAKVITGTTWSGMRFFGLAPRARQRRRAPTAATFIELPSLGNTSPGPVGDARTGGSTVVELVESHGARMRVEVTGVSSLDVVGLVQAFWGRES